MSDVNVHKFVHKLWEDLCIEIKEKNRFFVKDDVINILDGISYIPLFPTGLKLAFYRARVGDYINKNDSEMLAPPNGMACDGRCNPKGISYLYLSSDKSTAISEVKPNPFEEVTIAKLDVDLTNIFSFSIYNEEFLKIMEKFDVRKMGKKEVELINCINESMSRKIQSDNKLDYLPLQYITEYIKNKGYNGFVYASTVGSGMNLVMFNWKDKINIIQKSKVQIQSIEYKFKEI